MIQEGIYFRDLKFKLVGLFFDQIIQLNSKSVMAWNNKGTALGSLGRHEEALQAFDKAIQLNPNESWLGATKVWPLVVWAGMMKLFRHMIRPYCSLPIIGSIELLAKTT